MKRLLVTVLSAFAFSGLVRAGTITIFDTGVDSSNALLAEGSVDPHYLLNGGPAYVGADQNTLPYDPHGDGISQWINPTPVATDNVPPGTYIFTTMFTLPVGFTSASLSGQWEADNNGVLTMNGGLPISTIPGPIGFQAWTPFTITSGFMAGTNTLTFTVGNDFGPSGVRVEFTNALFSTPDTGSSAALLGGSLLVIGVFGRLQRSRSTI